MFNTLQVMFAGLWPLMWKFGFTGLLIAGCVALYVFTPAFLAKKFPNIQKVLIWVASGLTISLVSYAVGVGDEHRRNVAQEIRASENAYADARKAAADAPLQVKKRSTAAGRKPSVWVRAPKRDGHDLSKKP